VLGLASQIRNGGPGQHGAPPAARNNAERRIALRGCHDHLPNPAQRSLRFRARRESYRRCRIEYALVEARNSRRGRANRDIILAQATRPWQQLRSFWAQKASNYAAD